MIILALTTDKLQLITSSAATVDVVVSYGEVDQSTPPGVKPFGKQLTAISSATTTDILAAPGASTTRTPEEITICNKHASLACDVTPLYNANGTLFTIQKVTLNPGEMLEYVRGIGWFRLASAGVPAPNFSVADQSLPSVDTYITGSLITIPNSRPIAIGTIFEWNFVATKTAAGVAGPVFSVRFGTAGAVADSARLTFTGAAQTAVIDAAVVKIRAVVRGPIGAACIVAGDLELNHNLASTGFSVTANDVMQNTSAGFDCTTAGMLVGVSANPGASGVWTVQECTAKVSNI